MDTEQLTTREWDCIVVGTGMGGSVLGLMLAQAGWRILFIERGRQHFDGEEIAGRYAETSFRPSDYPQEKHADVLSRAGRYPEALVIEKERRSHLYVPFIGSGTGGSTALYGMALERFFPADFTPARKHPAAEIPVPEAWPFTYEDLQPYYARAEQLFEVRGAVDPLRPPASAAEPLAAPPLSPLSEKFFRHFQAKGLHPYRIPLACRFVDDCQVCQGFLCQHACKQDAASVALVPAIRAHGAGLLDRCRVESLTASASRVERIVCERDGQRFELSAPVVVLAAGALNTPRILLSSANSHWGNGLANRSGQVGRNLMHHYTDLYAVTPDEPGENHHKEIAFNDFYDGPHGALGTVQTFGRLPPAAMLAESLKADIAKSPFRPLVPFYQIVKPMLRPTLTKLVDNSAVFATICEDLPRADNRVAIVNGRIHVRYRVDGYGTRQISSMRRLMKDVLAPFRYQLIKQAENPELLAHVCGTCRAGRLPADSVVDGTNKCHDVDNLYIVDASFFPSSGGTNPALTIAANAMRVADHMVRHVH